MQYHKVGNRIFPNIQKDIVSSLSSLASSYSCEVIDLSLGNPVDSVASIIQNKLTNSSAYSRYPSVFGTTKLRNSIVMSLQRRYNIEIVDSDAVLPVIGTKEIISYLPMLMGIKSNELIAIPPLSYPVYEIGANMVGAQTLRTDSIEQLKKQNPSLVYINSPNNPTGQTLDLSYLYRIVNWAQKNNIIIVSDECYIGFNWESSPYSILHPSVSKNDYTGLVAIHSLSKISSLANYRAGFLAGDLNIISGLLNLRKKFGMIVPGPIQSSIITALSDDKHLTIQQNLYARRRAVLMSAMADFGFTKKNSEAGLYLWVTNGESCIKIATYLAEHGILVSPGRLYGPSGENHIRLSITITDDQISKFTERLSHVK